MSSDTPLGTTMKNASETQWNPFRVAIFASFGHDAEGPRVDVPAGGRNDDVAGTLAELLHGRRGPGRVILDRRVEFSEVRPGLVPAVDGVLRDPCRPSRYGNPIMKVRPGPEFAGRAYMKRFGLALAQARSSSAVPGTLFTRSGAYSSSGPRRIIVDHDAETLALGSVKVQRRGLVILLEARQAVGVGGQKLQPEILLEPGRETVAARQNHVEVDASRILLRLDLAGEFRSGRLDVGDARDEFGLGLRYASKAFCISASAPPTSMMLRATGDFGRAGLCCARAPVAFKAASPAAPPSRPRRLNVKRCVAMSCSLP